MEPVTHHPCTHKETRTRQCSHGPPLRACMDPGRVMGSTGNSGASGLISSSLSAILVVIEARDRSVCTACRSAECACQASGSIARGRVCMLSLIDDALASLLTRRRATSLLSRELCKFARGHGPDGRMKPRSWDGRPFLCACE
jgi:hypothetical protein